MKQKRTTTIALVSGVACAICIGAFMTMMQSGAENARTEALARYGGEQVDVCVATRDIAAGERIDYSAVETKAWIAGLLPDGAICKSEEALGKVATSSILKGEVFAQKRFQENQRDFTIPAGKQAVSVPVKTVQAVGGTIQPGMEVNIYATGDNTTTLLANSVVVLDTSMGESGSLTSSETGWITLAVEPTSVQEIIAASNKANLHFVLPGNQWKGEVNHESNS